MAKRDPWWKSAQTIVTLLGGIVMLCGLAYTNIASAERTKVAVEQVKEDVTDLEDRVEKQEDESEEYYRQQQLIQQDLGYLKESQKEILEAIKQKR